MASTGKRHKVLYSPGPTEVSPEILVEMARPVIGHRGAEMQDLIGAIVPRARTLFGAADHEVFLTSCSATGLWEGAIRNCVARRVLVPVNGAFSGRFHEVAVACGVEADALPFEPGRPVEPEAVDAALAGGRYDALALVHNETSTGVVNPLPEIADVVRRRGNVVLLLDAVSSLGGIPVEVDRNGIDVCLASVQKCLALPPGFSLCAVSSRAMERSRERRGKGYYFDFVRLKGYFDRRMPMATPSISHMYALLAQLKRIEAEGLEARYARHREMAEIVRGWAQRRFALFAAEGARSDTVTCVRNDRGLDVAGFISSLARRMIAISNGYGELKQKTFRIGHMGDHTADGMRALVRTLDEVLEASP